MKKLVGILCLTALTTGAFAQGLVKFANSGSTLFSIQTGADPSQVMVAPPNAATAATTYYFGLIYATPGSSSWSFAGVYATNTTATTGGRLQGGSLLGVTCTGWVPGVTNDFRVVGWARPTWAPFDLTWLNGLAGAAAGGLTMIGESAIATAPAGGLDPVTQQTVPALALFSGLNISTGWTLTPVPEPATFALAGLGAAALLIFRRRK